MGKRELIALLNLSFWCLVMVERLFLAVPRGCLQFVIVVFPDHTHLLFLHFISILAVLNFLQFVYKFEYISLTYLKQNAFFKINNIYIFFKFYIEVFSHILLLFISLNYT